MSGAPEQRPPDSRFGERGVGERYCQQAIWSEQEIVGIDNVGATGASQKGASEGLARLLLKRSEAVSIMAQPLLERCDAGQAVDPQGVDLDRLARSLSDRPSVNPGIHPGERETVCTLPEKRVRWIHP